MLLISLLTVQLQTKVPNMAYGSIKSISDSILESTDGESIQEQIDAYMQSTTSGTTNDGVIANAAIRKDTGAIVKSLGARAKVVAEPAVVIDRAASVTRDWTALMMANDQDNSAINAAFLSDEIAANASSAPETTDEAFLQTGVLPAGGDTGNGLMSSLRPEARPASLKPAPDLIDFSFIMEQEGFKQNIYVPRDEGGVKALGKSGPTIASGFDLGQRNLADLAGLPPALISKLEPYLGLKKQAAIDFVKANALNITEEETAIINSFAKDQETGRLIKLWNKTSKTPWGDLTSEQATVVASVAFQFGNLSIKAPTFWGHVTKGNWDMAIGELRNFGDKTPSRRNREADYLESGTF